MSSSGKAITFAVMLGACNQALGLRDTELSDGPPPDAPFACPSDGAPVFSRLIYQVHLQFCTAYSIAAASDTAAALCLSPDRTQFEVMIGPAGGPLDLAPGIAGTGLFTAPRLTPDGDELYVMRYQTITGWQHLAFRRDTTGTWQVEPTPVPFGVIGDEISTIAHMPTGYRLVQYAAAQRMLYERTFDRASATWSVAGMRTIDELGLAYVTSVSLTGDGLHMLFAATTAGTAINHVFDADRPSDDLPFGLPVRLEGVPPVDDPFMTSDCARMYFSGIGQVLYVQQQ